MRSSELIPYRMDNVLKTKEQMTTKLAINQDVYQAVNRIDSESYE